MSLQDRPKSAKNRRLRTATHKVTDPRFATGRTATVREEESISDDFQNLDIDDELQSVVVPPPAAAEVEVRKTSPASVTSSASSSTYDSLMTFEGVQKASALRVLAKTLDRQRDVAATKITDDGVVDVSYRKTAVAAPRKLRPLEQMRQYSGPF